MLSEVAAAVKVDAQEIGDQLESLRADVTLLQIHVGAAEDLDSGVKSSVMSNLSAIWVMLDALALKFNGDGEKKEGIVGDLMGVVSTIVGNADQTKLPV